MGFFASNGSNNSGMTLEYNFCSADINVLVSLASSFALLGIGCSATVVFVCHRHKVECITSKQTAATAFATVQIIFIFAYLFTLLGEVTGACGFMNLSSATCKAIHWSRQTSFVTMNYCLAVAVHAAKKTKTQGKIIIREIVAKLIIMAFLSASVSTYYITFMEVDEIPFPSDTPGISFVCFQSSPYIITIEILLLGLGTILPTLATFGIVIHSTVVILNKWKKLGEINHKILLHPSNKNAEKNNDQCTSSVSASICNNTRSRETNAHVQNSPGRFSSDSEPQKHLGLYKIGLRLRVEAAKKKVQNRMKDILGMLMLIITYTLMTVTHRVVEVLIIAFSGGEAEVGKSLIHNLIKNGSTVYEQILLLGPLIFPCVGFPLYALFVKSRKCRNHVRSIRRRKVVRLHGLQEETQEEYPKLAHTITVICSE